MKKLYHHGNKTVYNELVKHVGKKLINVEVIETAYRGCVFKSVLILKFEDGSTVKVIPVSTDGMNNGFALAHE